MNSGISSGLGSENVDSIFSSGSSNSLRAEIFYSLVWSKMFFFLSDLKRVDKVGCVYPMAAMSRLPRAEFGRNGSTLFGQQFRLRIWLILKEVILFTTITTDDFQKKIATGDLTLNSPFSLPSSSA